MDVIKLNEFPSEPAQGQIYEIIPDKSRIVSSTNRLFNKYPTRYISAVPRFAILKYSIKGDTVLDPFCGSGTTAIEALLNGRNALSIDIDPFARLLIKVKTTHYRNEDIIILDRIIEEMKKNAPDSKMDYDAPDIPNIDKWFCTESVMGLSFLKHQIDILASDNEKVHDYLYIVLAAIIRNCSNADNVSPKPYISTRFPKEPGEPIPLFYKTETLYRAAIIDFSEVVEPFQCENILLESNDARVLSEDIFIDLAVTSPPYINAYDYVRSLKFENMWLGLANEGQLRERRKSYVGTEIIKSFYNEFEYASESPTLKTIVEKIDKVDTKKARMVMTYFEDMAINMCAVHRSLITGGRYVLVVGDSKIRSQVVPTAKILEEIAEKNGYAFELSFKYVIRDRYLHLPRGNRGGIIKYDEVLVISKK